MVTGPRRRRAGRADTPSRVRRLGRAMSRATSRATSRTAAIDGRDERVFAAPVDGVGGFAVLRGSGLGVGRRSGLGVARRSTEMVIEGLDRRCVCAPTTGRWNEL